MTSPKYVLKLSYMDPAIFLDDKCACACDCFGVCIVFDVFTYWAAPALGCIVTVRCVSKRPSLATIVQHTHT